MPSTTTTKLSTTVSQHIWLKIKSCEAFSILNAFIFQMSTTTPTKLSTTVSAIGFTAFKTAKILIFWILNFSDAHHHHHQAALHRKKNK